MRISIEIDDTQVQALTDGIWLFNENGVSAPLELSANRILGLLKSNIVAGQDIHDNGYGRIKPSTYEQEIARSGPFKDIRIRKNVSGDAIAMNVTGESLNSLSMEEVNSKEFNVGFSGARSEVVFYSNAKNPGKTNKEVRDPLGLNESQPTEFEMDVVEKNINDAIDRLLNGLYA